MTDSYLVLISAAGVELLGAETPHTRRFLTRRCETARGRLACYWALLSECDAVAIGRLAKAGLYRDSFAWLTETALDAGLIAPLDGLVFTGESMA